jgi:hypothetical protein
LPDALKRMLDAVRVISDLQSGLAPRAQLSAVYGVFRITCQFLSQPHFDDPELPVPDNLSFAFHYTHLDPTACRAHRANAGLPDSYTGHKFFFGYKAD